MIEGILIRKTPFQERHLIGNLLLRNGKSLSVLFYGGQGGGKKSKPSNLELGHLFNVTPVQGKKYSDLMRSKEWSLKWSHSTIRKSYKKYVNLCFFVEIISKILINEDATQQAPDTDRNMEFSGAYKVLSNAIYFLEKHFDDKQNSFHLQSFFLCKLLIELGVFPNLNECLISGRNIKDSSSSRLLPDQGGFALTEELDEESSHEKSHQKIRNIFLLSASTKWQEYQITSSQITSEEFQIILNYFCFQMNFDLASIKSSSSIT